MKYAVAALAGVALYCLITGLLFFINRGRLDERRRVEALQDEQQKRSGLFGRKRAAEGELPTRKGLEKLADELYTAGVALRAEEFVAIWAAAAVGIPAFALFLGVKPVFAVGLAVLGAAAPILLVKMGRKKRLALFDSQLIDALNVMTNSLRAGVSFQSAMKNVSEEMAEPISKEFGRVYRETQMGMSMDESFARLVRRTENADLELICSAVLIQKQIGGNLAKVLENIAETISERVKLRGEVKTLTASGTTSGYIIGALPMVILLALMFVNPTYVETFFNTKAGNIMLIVSAALEAAGFVLIKKIVDIKP